MRRAALLLLLAAGAAQADPWDTTDKVLGAAAVAALVVDWGQTRYIAQHPGQYYEHNALLPDHPTLGQVNRHFAVALAGTLLIADYLSPPNRKIFLSVITGFELAVTTRNRSIGVKIAF